MVPWCPRVGCSGARMPDVYPRVDDEAEIVLNYAHAVAIIEASWNWPYSLKQMDLYGKTGSALEIDAEILEAARQSAQSGKTVNLPLKGE